MKEAMTETEETLEEGTMIEREESIPHLEADPEVVIFQEGQETM